MAARKPNVPADAHIALIRGINVGGKGMLPMADLKAMFAAARCNDVQTYIQSGNVVFRASDAVAKKIPKLIAAAIADQFGFEAPVLTRSAAELAAVVKNNPFVRSGSDPKTLHVAFLAELPAKTRIAALDPKRSPPDEFVVRGREIYLMLPNGAGRTKLTIDYFEKKLGTSFSQRNWRTVLTLLELVSVVGRG